MQVMKGSEDHPSQYMNFMNVVFTAQKLGVVIDACVLDNESGLLQQVGRSFFSQCSTVNPFNTSCFKLLLFEGFSAILV